VEFSCCKEQLVSGRDPVPISSSDEYQAEAVRTIEESGNRIGAIARELGPRETGLRRWVLQTKIDAGRGPRAELTTSECEELATVAARQTAASTI
jgi:transposase-like protein